MLVRVWKKRNIPTLLVGKQTGATDLENTVEVPQNVKNKTTLRPSNSTAGYLPKGCKNTDSNGYMHPNDYSSIVNNSQIMETA